MLEGWGGELSQKKELFSLPPHKSGKTSDVENPEMTFVCDPWAFCWEVHALQMVRGWIAGPTSSLTSSQ